MNTRWMGRVAGVICVSLAAAALARGQVLYHVAAEMTPPPGYFRGASWAINNNQQVASSLALQSWPVVFPCRWDAQTGWLPLGGLPGCAPEGEGLAINNLGHVAGEARGTSGSMEAFYWSPATGMMPLGKLPGGSTPAYHCGGMNDHNQVVGTGHSNYGQGSNTEAYVWAPGTELFGLGDLPGGGFGSGGDDINNARVACGVSWSNKGNEAFIWDIVHGMRTLGGQPPGHQALDARSINEHGQVCGLAYTPQGSMPYFWDPVEGLTVIPKPPGQFGFGWAQRLNDAGQVIGLFELPYTYTKVPFIWDAQNGTRLLDDLLDASSRPGEVWGAADINAHGHILANVFPLGMVLLEPFLLGDMNCDGAVNLDDVVPFVIGLVDPPGHAQQYPGCHGDWAGDINQDAAFNAFDIDPFVALLVGP